MQIYIPPTDKDQLLLELQKPACTAKALQALFDDRCLSYIKKEAIMEVLKDLVKTNKANSKAHSKGGQDAKGKPFNLLQMIIRYTELRWNQLRISILLCQLVVLVLVVPISPSRHAYSCCRLVAFVHNYRLLDVLSNPITSLI